MLKSYKIKETDEYDPLSVLFHESGMEIAISDVPPEGMEKYGGLTMKKRGN